MCNHNHDFQHSGRSLISCDEHWIIGRIIVEVYGEATTQRMRRIAITMNGTCSTIPRWRELQMRIRRFSLHRPTCSSIRRRVPRYSNDRLLRFRSFGHTFWILLRLFTQLFIRVSCHTSTSRCRHLNNSSSSSISNRNSIRIAFTIILLASYLRWMVTMVVMQVIILQGMQVLLLLLLLLLRCRRSSHIRRYAFKRRIGRRSCEDSRESNQQDFEEFGRAAVTT